MSHLVHVRVFGAVTGVVSALAFAIPANAAVKADCFVDGEVKAETTKPAPLKYVQLVGGKGTFSMRALALRCTDLGAGKGPAPGHTGTIDATGTFRQSQFVNGQWLDTTCGAGKWLGTVTRVAMNHPKFDVVVGKKFGIEFNTAAKGAFYWHAGNPNKPSFVFKLQPDSGDARYQQKDNPAGNKNYQHAGQLVLTASRDAAKDPASEMMKAQAHPNKCTKGFHINGRILVDEA